MELSLAKDKTNFVTTSIPSFEGIKDVILKSNYSLSTFKDNYRNKDNFLKAETLALDFDSGMTLNEAKLQFAGYKHIIATTRSHQKEKNGLKCDRFRVILNLEQTITDPEIYVSTYKALLDKFPQADKATKDPSRMFYPSTTIISTKLDGLDIKAIIVDKSTQNAFDTSHYKSGDKIPEGWSKCKWSILQGNFEAGEGNEAMMAIATTMRNAGYTKGMTRELCLNALDARLARTGADYKDGDFDREVLKPVFEAKNKPHYSCKTEHTWLHDYCCSLEDGCNSGVSDTLDLTQASKLKETAGDIDWLVDGLFTVGGLSIIAGPPKSGKSTIARQLMIASSRGEKFLERKCAKSKVVYLAIEEQDSILAEQYEGLGITETDDIFVHVGPIPAQDKNRVIRNTIEKLGARLLFIDTIMLYGDVQDSNNYNELNRLLADIRNIARETQCHICVIHHANKGGKFGSGSIHGSVAIHGAVDCAFIVNVFGDKRVLTTSQRGGRPFVKRRLLFNKANETYSLGADDFETGDF